MTNKKLITCLGVASLVLITFSSPALNNATEIKNPNRAFDQIDFRTKAIADYRKKQLATFRDKANMRLFTLGEMKKYGWNMVQYSCLHRLWTKESNWRWNALNKNSGAYGIPQSWPADKMAMMGSDWRSNPRTQIRWGLHYIKNSRYKKPCVALQHSIRHNWY